MPDKKKIILIGSIPPPYHGSSIYFNNLLNSRVREVFDVTHLDISDHRNLDNLSRLDFTNVYLALKNQYLLFKMLQKIKPDLVYIPIASNFLPYLRDGLFIIISSYFSRAKIITHLHEGNYFRDEFYNKSNSIVKFFIKKSLNKVNTSIVLSENLKRVFESLVNKVSVCPNGVEDEFESDDNILKPKTEHFIISYLGNLFESKGILDIINAAKIVSEKYDYAEFHFAGDWSTKEGNTKEKADHLIAFNKLEQKIKFYGVITGNEKKVFLSQTNIFIFPSWYPYEGFPLAIIEAMSAGCPVISTKDTGAIPDIIVNGKTGFLIEKKNPQQLAEKIIQLIEDSTLRKQMSVRARARFEELYTLDRNINKMITVFNEALN